MYAAAHTSLALAAKRTNPTASLFGLMVTAQASELLWVGLTYAGIEHSTVDDHGTLHLEDLPYSHSLLIGLGLGAVLWALLRWVVRRPQLAAILVLNVLNLPLMLTGEGSASPMAHNPFLLPTTILITI